MARAILSGIVKYSNKTIEYTITSPLDTLDQTQFPAASKRFPSDEQLKIWRDAKMYGVRVDGKDINNAELLKFRPSDFGLYYITTLGKDLVGNKRYYYQVDLMTNEYYEKIILNRMPPVEPHDTTPPLIVIDGKEKPGLTISNLDKEISTANDIEAINVLKGTDATAKYGEKGKNGVIEIITKKAKPGEIKKTGIENVNTDKDEGVVFEKVEIEPSFPGGYVAWQKFLERNLNSTIPIQNHAPPGKYTVYVEFVVNKDGSISNVRPLTNHGFGMEKEALRVIEDGPSWAPGIQNGHKVNTYRKQPITFDVVDGDNYEVTVLGHKSTEKRDVPVEKKTSNELNEVVVVGFSNTVFEKVEIEAAFPGGEAAWKKFLESNLDPLIPTKNNAAAGVYTVYIQFIVHTDGNISDVKALTNHGFGMEQEAIRLIKKGPKWIPGIQNGDKVNSCRKQPVNFVVGKDEKKVQNKTDNTFTRDTSRSNRYISTRDLQKASVYDLLQVDAGTEIVSFKFTIDGQKEIYEEMNTGNKFSASTKKLINSAEAGRIITLEEIVVVKDNAKRRIPSLFYYLQD